MRVFVQKNDDREGFIGPCFNRIGEGKIGSRLSNFLYQADIIDPDSGIEICEDQPVITR